MRTRFRLSLVVLVAVTVVAGTGHAQMMPPQGPTVTPGMGLRGYARPHKPLVRHLWYMRKGLPAAYRQRHNPLPASGAVIKRGAALFAEHCVACHGPEGRGDGEAGKDLEPPPTDLGFILSRPVATDPFLFWTLSEGGAPLGTDMPVFKDLLSEDDRWSVIHYLRAGIAPKPEDPTDW